MKRVPTWPVEKQARNVFDWLDGVRQRPLMYIRDETDVRTLESLLRGYGSALDVHQIDEQVPDFGHVFLDWLKIRYRWSTSLGWAEAILRATRPEQRPLDLFFEVVDEYRKVSPRVIARAVLGPANQATGEVGTDGRGRARPPPRELEIVQYSPERLFLLRYRYSSSVHEYSMYDKNGRFETSVDFAKRLAWREFRITKSQWESVARARGHRRTPSKGRPRRRA